MQRYKAPEVKRHPDGSIDSGYYIKIGRRERAVQARAVAKALTPKRGTFSLPFWVFSTSRI